MPKPVLRDYQVGLVDRLRDAFRRHRRVLCVVPTGGGKTVVAGAIIEMSCARGSRILFLAHRKELIDQASAKLDEYGISHGVIKAGHPRQDLAEDVQVASVQTLVRRLAKLTAGPTVEEQAIGASPAWRQPFSLIIIDEAHHVAAESYRTIMAAYPQACVLGLTATPYRIDGRGLDDAFETLVVGATVPALIAANWLVPTRTFAPPPPEALESVHLRAGEYQVDEAAAILDRVGPLQEIVTHWQRLAADRLTVAFCCTVAHAEHLAAAYRAAGVAAAAIDGTMGDAQRSQILADLRAQRLRVVVNVALLTEGWDLPAISCVVEARPTKSRTLWRQIVGRGMRVHPGKRDCLILDHAANGHRFGIPDQADVYQLSPEVIERGKRTAGVALAVSCPFCHYLLHVRKPFCPGCGGRMRDERSMATLRGEVELAELAPADEAQRFLFYRSCVSTARMRGKRLGWVYHRYVDRWGEQPPAWMPVKAGIYEDLFHRPVPPRLLELARDKGNGAGVLV